MKANGKVIGAVIQVDLRDGYERPPVDGAGHEAMAQALFGIRGLYEIKTNPARMRTLQIIYRGKESWGSIAEMCAQVVSTHAVEEE